MKEIIANKMLKVYLSQNQNEIEEVKIKIQIGLVESNISMLSRHMIEDFKEDDEHIKLTIKAYTDEGKVYLVKGILETNTETKIKEIKVKDPVKYYVENEYGEKEKITMAEVIIYWENDKVKSIKSIVETNLDIYIDDAQINVYDNTEKIFSEKQNVI